MSRRPLALRMIVPLVAFSCKIPAQMTPPSAAASAAEVAVAGASVMIGVGDIAVCGTNGAEQTAKLVDSVLRADSVAKVNDEVFTLGDNAYPDGAASNFALCFTPSWGDSNKRIMKKIHPAAGNHEHQSLGAAPYYEYFGSRAGSSKKGYYSYNVGEWHVIVLNSEIVVNGSFSDAERKAQEDWLRNELKGTQKPCTMAYWHHPRFSSGWHGDDVSLQPLWQILYDGGADLILNGHDHDYERFLPQTPLGVADSAKGMAEYVVGTGGGDLRGFRSDPTPHSAARVEGYFGVLKLTLGKGEFRAAFLDVSGRIWDPSGGKCHRASTAALALPLMAQGPVAGPVAGPPLSPRPPDPVVRRTADGTVLGAIGAVDANELEEAKLAVTKASASEVRNLATTLVKDHELSSQTGARLAKQFSIARLLPADSAMAREHVVEMAQLNTLTGAAFDKAFVENTLADHKALIAQINGTLLAAAQRPQVKAFVRALLPQLSAHQQAEEKWLAAHP